ncbi:MAG: winged helix-turn-helix transcriptional regulator [Sedimentisphaerales bacterium]|nr:winged helix-turn-helix transcriptional regulator [Sedimentisphaerales bacterium]
MITQKKQLLFEKQAEIVKAIAHPLRIAIVDFLKDGEQCVCDIAEHVGSERSNVSRHLSVMVNAGVLEYRKKGLKVIYKLKTPCILDFFSCITACLKQRAKENEKLLKSL